MFLGLDTWLLTFPDFFGFMARFTGKGHWIGELSVRRCQFAWHAGLLAAELRGQYWSLSATLYWKKYRIDFRERMVGNEAREASLHCQCLEGNEWSHNEGCKRVYILLFLGSSILSNQLVVALRNSIFNLGKLSPLNPYALPVDLSPRFRCEVCDR